MDWYHPLPIENQNSRPEGGGVEVCKCEKRCLFPFRPILMQLDLQSLEKNSREYSCVFQYVGMSFCPENVGNWFSSPQNESSAVSRFSRGPAAGNHRQHIFDPTGSETITIPDGIENPSTFFRAKAHANELKGRAKAHANAGQFRSGGP